MVDASVAVKWLVKEPGSAAAVGLLAGEEQFTAPNLIQVEVAGAVARKASRGDIAEAEAQKAFGLWQRLLSSDRLRLNSDGIDLPVAFAMSLRLSHPVQDCLYLSLANRHGIELLTADERFVDRVASAYTNVRLFES